MHFETFSPSDFEKLEPFWKELEAGMEMTAFQFYDWYKIINGMYFKEKTKNHFRVWQYILVRDNDKPVMIAPLQIVKHGFGFKVKSGGKTKQIGVRKCASFIGINSYSDYLNLIYKEFNPKAFEEIIQYVKSTFGIDNFYFERLLEQTSTYKYIEKNKTITEKGDIYCAAINLPDTFEEYKATLSKNSRQNLRTALNRQQKENVILTHRIVYSFNDEFNNKLIEIREQRLEEKIKREKKRHGNFVMNTLAGIYDFFYNLKKKMFDASQDIMTENVNPWCFLVEEGDNIAGYYWGIYDQYNSEYYIILAGVNKDYIRYTPSASHLYSYIQEQYESGNKTVKVFDFTRGAESYKRSLGGTDKPAYKVEFKG